MNIKVNFKECLMLNQIMYIFVITIPCAFSVYDSLGTVSGWPDIHTDHTGISPSRGYSLCVSSSSQISHTDSHTHHISTSGSCYHVFAYDAVGS